MDRFKKIIENKTVAIVGPAQYMMGLKLGKEIDSFDVVVRLNRSCESISKYSENIGKKTNILYSCLIEKPANAGEIDIKKYKNEYRIEYICAPPASNMKGYASQTILHDLINVEKIIKLNKEIPVRIIDHTFNNHIASQVNCRPNTGYLAIYDLLRFNPKKLKVFGYSFYLDGFIKDVKRGIMKEQNKSEEDFALQCFNSKRHNQNNIWEHAKYNLTQLPNVFLDPVLSEILQMKSLDRKHFKNKILKQ